MPAPSLHDRIYRALLKLFPREFRGDFGEQMTDDFRDQREDAGGSSGSLTAVWTRTVADIVRRAPREHLDVLGRDAGYAVRLFRRRPGMTISAVLTLAIGIGLNAAAFSVVHGVLWRSLLLPESDRLVRVSEYKAPETAGTAASPANFLDWEKQTRTLDALATMLPYSGTIVLQDGAEDFLGAAVTRDFFRMLPARPLLGRLLHDADYEPLALQIAARNRKQRAPKLAPSVMVISHDLWQRQFGGRQDVVGTKVDLGAGGIVEVVGVMPQGFVNPFYRNAVAWFPDVVDGGQVRRGVPYSFVLGRLAPGVTVDEAQAEFQVIASQLEAAYPEDNKGNRVQVVSLLESVTAGVRSQLWFLFATAGAVLLIACANVSNLLLTLTAGRRREFATRVAVGASRAHLVRQAIVEGLVLALAGGTAGLLLAKWAVPALASRAPRNIPRLDEVAVDWQVAAFTMLISVAIGLVAGLAAAIAASRFGIETPLRTAGVAGGQGRRFRQALIVGEVALALMLAVAASLLVQTMRTVMALPLGFDPANVIAVNISQGLNNRSKSEFDSQIVSAIRALPGVVAAGVGSRPLSPGGMGTAINRSDDPATSIRIDVEPAGAGYLEALGGRLVEGRFFTSEDHARAPLVALVNETAARQYWPGGAIGRRFVQRKEPVTIVGVLRDVRRRGLEENPRATIYVPDLQTQNFWANGMLVRTNGNPRELLPAIRTLVRSIDPKLPVSRVETLEERFAAVTAPRRFTLWLVGLFSLIALALAAIGVYGVVSESVGQRVPEIGVRMALGASTANVVALVVRQGGVMIVLGVLLGAAGALSANGVMASFVFGVETTNAWSYAAAVGGLIAVTLCACLVPARRAARIDPVMALRKD
jgi:putative ABC transport system permease protein